MSTRADLEPDERDLDRLLSSVPPTPLPIGFRDAVMDRVQTRGVTWEWIVAVLFALPSVAYLARLVMVHGEEFAQALGNVVTAASSETTDAFFFVDGLTVIALALLGIACALAAHALFATGPSAKGRGRTALR